MREFFVDDVVGMPFKLFGVTYLGITLLFIVTALLIIINRKKIHELPSDIKNKIKWTIIIIMFINMTIYYGAKIYYGVWDYRVHLPLHLCFISGYLFMFAQATDNKPLCRISMFLAFMGPIPAIIWPELRSSFDCFVFYQYIISHHFFTLSAIFLYFSRGDIIRLSDVIKTFILVNIIYFVMSIFNAIYDTNYIMSSKLPQYIVDLYPFLKHVTNPTLMFEAMACFILISVYLPISYHNKSLKIREEV